MWSSTFGNPRRTAQPYIPDMVAVHEAIRISIEGALVVDVKEEGDTKEIPPCMILKSDGASLYTTTDLATIVERMKLFAPDEILYVVTNVRNFILSRCSAVPERPAL